MADPNGSANPATIIDFCCCDVNSTTSSCTRTMQCRRFGGRVEVFMSGNNEEFSDPGCWETDEERRAGFLSILSERESEIVDVIRGQISEDVFNSLIDWLERLSFPLAMRIREMMNPDHWMEIAEKFAEPQRTALTQRIASNRETFLLLQELLLLRAQGVIRELEEFMTSLQRDSQR